MGDRAFRTKLLLAFAAVYLIWGSTYLAIRYAVETLPPFGMASARFLFAGSILYAVARLRGASPPTPRMWRDTGIVGTLMLLGGNGLVTWAEQKVPSGIAALIVACVPLFMVVLQRRVPGIREGVGLAGGLVGIALLVGKPGSAGAVDLLGAGALVLASLSWAMGSLFSRRAELPESGVLATGMEMLGGSAALGLFALFRGEVAIRRRRQCTKCDKRFTTYEKVRGNALWVVKKDGRREPFDREKVKRGILRAVEKRPISMDLVDDIVEKVEREMLRMQKDEVGSKAIRRAVLKRLKKVDKVAWLRFASVYLEFEDLEDFAKAIKT